MATHGELLGKTIRRLMEQELIIRIIELLGTFAFAISGIRHAAAKQFDWFGGYVCGVAVAIGGGTIRDVMLGTGKWMEPLKNAWFVFDTLGLALFTIAGIQKSLAFGQPFWVAIIMGCITGSAGGVIRDVLLNNEPVIFHKEIYAMACVLGGVVYWGLVSLGLTTELCAVVSFLVTCLTRFLAVRYHISLPVLKESEKL